MIFYYDDLGNVASYSEEKNDMPQFKEFEYEPTNEEMEQIKQNYLLTVEKDKLVITKPPEVVAKDEVIANKDELVEKSQTGTLTADDILNFIIKHLI